jgi:phage terminase large subunit-like protein
LGHHSRRGGKSRAIATLAVYLAAFCDHRNILAPGEVATLPILSASVSQSQTIFNYVAGLLEVVPSIGSMVTRKTADTIGLSSGVEIAVRPASFRTIRGSSMIAVIADEIAFWRSDEASRNCKN